MTSTTGELLVGDTSFVSSWARIAERPQLAMRELGVQVIYLPRTRDSGRC